MKRTYETPTAEKLEFDYTNVVTASGRCRTGGEYSEYGLDCHEKIKEWIADVVD